jgi:outer membrane lipoprotein carrier protein
MAQFSKPRSGSKAIASTKKTFFIQLSMRAFFTAITLFLLLGTKPLFAQPQVSAISKTPLTSLEALNLFIKSTQSGRAHFTQIVTTASKNESQTARPARVKKSQGVFSFLRPEKFRFEYDKPFAQSIVADGQTLWIYDPDIEQVSARAQAKALGSTPASLIASSGDLSTLERDFLMTAEADSENLQWVKATPKNTDTQLHWVRIGMVTNNAQVQLVKLEILDAFGQKSVMSFDNFEPNPSGLNASAFKFTPPHGVEIIKP